ncbi:glycoside hydrolase family 20 protein [Gelatoporia subvermispora B]|uniref:Beta-hexosaminidase n=1 Tax=Ceriporiopsis subvermispora (strain B) TaxID=914234 RepID=M2R4Z6_CERS8|nr:glycoside hydrolase family 20 protein [Gelatoporia subvermispora B]
MVLKLALLVAALVAVVSPAAALWPQPRNITTGSTALRLSPLFTISLSSIHGAPSDLVEAVARAETYARTDNLGRLVVGRGSSDVAAYQHAKTLSVLELSLSQGAKVQSITTEAQKPLEERDEAYTLSIPSDGSTAKLTASSTLGLFHGLTTFGQLWYENAGTIYTLSTPVDIEDSPAYPYRGLMLDTARNFFPVSDIYRTLDAMSMVKINTFHWHVVDSQSFPLEVPGFTDLAEKGAYDPTMVYTATDVKNIVAYAGARGIDVMVEIDTPGHTAIISQAHPEFVACAQSSPWSTFANEPPAGQLRFADPNVTQFTTELLHAVAEMFPGTMLSTGGDELNIPCYDADTETQSLLQSSGQTLEEALNVYVQAEQKTLASVGKTPAVWEEMVLVQNVTLSPDTLVLVWISSDDVKAVAQAGFKIIHSASDYFYLDCGGGGWVGDNPSGNSWCDPMKTWQLSYTFDPVANLTADEAKLVMGGQHLLWTEQSGPENLDPIVWPRAASSAELFWSGPGGNVTSALPRLHDVSFRMRQRGVNSINLQPLWCALRPDACDLNA